MEPVHNNYCQEKASDKIYIIDNTGKARYLHPHGTDPIPAVYGHLSVLVEDELNSLAPKKIYYYGGRIKNTTVQDSNKCIGKRFIDDFCSDIFELTLPSAPLSQTVWASSSTTAVWRRVSDLNTQQTFQPLLIGSIFGNMIYDKRTKSIFIFNGYKVQS
jgi:hypothetical protein